MMARNEILLNEVVALEH